MAPPTAPPRPQPPPPQQAAGAMPAPGPSLRPLAIEAAEAELAAAEARERELELELEKLYGKAAHLCQSESRNLAYVGEQHKQVPVAIRKLQETLQQTSCVADELSGRVRKLDAICGRVANALKIVDDLRNLQECHDQVGKAIDSQDYEQAAQYIARFRASQDALVPGTDDTAVRVVKEAERTLTVIVRKGFETAMAAKDTAGVSRYAKLFHPLGLAGEGVQKYVQFLRQSMAENCAADFRLLQPAFGKVVDLGEMPYAETLMKVFLAIADLVQEHNQRVEDEFGPENFVLVLRGLLEEADINGLRVIDKFETDHARVFDQHASCEMREVGGVLKEAAMITQRTQQFNDYMHKAGEEVVGKLADPSAFIKELPAGYSETDGLPDPGTTNEGLVHRVQLLVNKFVMVEQTFLRKSMEKAIAETDSLDVSDPDQLTTTLVDDAFFILRECILRAMMTCNVDAVCAMVNYVSMAIGDETESLKAALVKNLRESKVLYNPWVSNIEHLVPPAKGEHPLHGLFSDPAVQPPLQSAHSWPHSLNNLQLCAEYMDRLKAITQDAFDEEFPEDESIKDKRLNFQMCLSGWDATKQELQALHAAKCKEGLEFFKVHLTPMLKPLQQLDYTISEQKYMDFQVNDPFAKAFISQAMLIHGHLRSVLNTSSCDEIMLQMADQTCRRIEREVTSKRFNLFGALQLDTDVRALCSFFTNVSEQVLRHKFARLLEMASLLNLESVAEFRELYGETRSWRLTPEEIRKLLLSRVDFDATEADLTLLLGS